MVRGGPWWSVRRVRGGGNCGGGGGGDGGPPVGGPSVLPWKKT